VVGQPAVAAVLAEPAQAAAVVVVVEQTPLEEVE